MTPLSHCTSIQSDHLKNRSWIRSLSPHRSDLPGLVAVTACLNARGRPANRSPCFFLCPVCHFSAQPATSEPLKISVTSITPVFKTLQWLLVFLSLKSLCDGWEDPAESAAPSSSSPLSPPPPPPAVPQTHLAHSSLGAGRWPPACGHSLHPGVYVTDSSNQLKSPLEYHTLSEAPYTSDRLCYQPTPHPAGRAGYSSLSCLLFTSV